MKEKTKKLVFIVVGVVLLLGIIALGIVCIQMNENNKKIKRNTEWVNEKYKKIKGEYSDLETKYNEAKENIKNLEREEEKTRLSDTIKKLNEEVTKLSNNKLALENEINSLKEDVIKVKGEAKSYPAGHLTVGTDVPEGRYKIYGGNSNFVVYSSSGRLQVNIILGERYGGVSEYIYTFSNGEKIEASSSFKLISVE